MIRRALHDRRACIQVREGPQVRLPAPRPTALASALWSIVVNYLMPRAQPPETMGRSPGESQTDQRQLSGRLDAACER